MPHAQRAAVKRAAPAEPSVKRILALDYGRARIGLALADSDARIARPLGLIVRKNRNEDMRRLREKLGSGARHLDTVRGVGYRFVADE